MPTSPIRPGPLLDLSDPVDLSHAAHAYHLLSRQLALDGRRSARVLDVAQELAVRAKAARIEAAYRAKQRAADATAERDAQVHPATLGFVSVHQAAAELGVGTGAVRARARRGTLTARRAADGWWIDPSDLTRVEG